MGWSRSLKVMGEDSWSRGCEFEFQLRILEWHYVHISFVKIVLFIWKDRKNIEWRIGLFRICKKGNICHCNENGLLGGKWYVLLQVWSSVVAWFYDAEATHWTTLTGRCHKPIDGGKFLLKKCVSLCFVLCALPYFALLLDKRDT